MFIISENNLISRQEAISKGLIHYFTGKPCNHGHICARYVKDYNCVVCKQIRCSKPEIRQLQRMHSQKLETKEKAKNKKISEEGKLRANNWTKSETGKISVKNSRLKTMYGITLEEYNLMLEEQNHSCAICNTTFNNQIKLNSCCVDHDHKTEIVRGLLCFSCNTMLGLAKENIDALLNAINYLNKYKISCIKKEITII